MNSKHPIVSERINLMCNLKMLMIIYSYGSIKFTTRIIY